MVWVTKVPAASSSFQVVVGLTLTCNSQHPQLRHCSSPHSCSQSTKNIQKGFKSRPIPKKCQTPWWWTDNWDILGGGFKTPSPVNFLSNSSQANSGFHTHQHPWPSNALPSAELLLPAEFLGPQNSERWDFSLAKN